MMNQSEIVSSSQITFITLFPASPSQHCYVFYESHHKLCNYAESSKPFSSANPAHFNFSSSNFNVQYDIVSTSPGVLSEHKNRQRVKQQPPESTMLDGVYGQETLFHCIHGPQLTMVVTYVPHAIYLPSSLQVCSILTYVHSNHIKFTTYSPTLTSGVVDYVILLTTLYGIIFR